MANQTKSDFGDLLWHCSVHKHFCKRLLNSCSKVLAVATVMSAFSWRACTLVHHQSKCSSDPAWLFKFLSRGVGLLKILSTNLAS